MSTTSEFTTESNGWSEWRRHLLAEMERQNELQKEFSRDLQAMRTDIAVVKSLCEALAKQAVEIQNLRSEVISLKLLTEIVKDHSAKLDKMSTELTTATVKNSFMGAVSGAIAAVIMLGISWLKNH